MSFHLRRTRDGAGDSGARSQAIEWDENGKFNKVIGYVPSVGCSMLVGSLSARTYSGSDYWLTTEITEIIEEINSDDVHYVKFKTGNSEYEWWNGDYPK
jgi:hypothetical protein